MPARLRFWPAAGLVLAALFSIPIVAFIVIQITTATDTIPWLFHLLLASLLVAFWSGLIAVRTGHPTAMFLLILSAAIALPLGGLWVLVAFGD